MHKAIKEEYLTFVERCQKITNDKVRKEKDDKTEKVESSKDDPNKSIPNSNSNVTFVNLFNTRSCKRSETLFKSLLFWLAGEVSLLAVEVLSPYRK